eukprot:10476029-Ditylum_brightwellii.AAC.1
MSAEIYRQFPGGLRQAEAEHGKPWQTLPIRFVPLQRPTKDDMDDSPLKTIMVELTQETTQKARKKHDLHDQADDAVLAQLDTIPKDTRNKKELAGIKKLQDMCMALDKKMDTLIAKAFNLYQQMLSPTIRTEWDDIIQKHCYTAGLLDKNSVASKEN